MVDATTPAEIARLEELLADGEPQPWHVHDGNGRPNRPSDYVEVALRSGHLRSCDSAFILWPWVEDDDTQGYVVEGDPQDDVIRWRFAKRPPSDRELAVAAPSLLATIAAQSAEIERLRASEARVREAAVGLRDDMLKRAEMNKRQNDGDLVVEAGAGVWFRFNEALTNGATNG